MGNLIHLNGNQLCAIDVETTGLIPFHHEITEVCFLPLNEKLEIRKDIPPFDVRLKIEYEDRIDWEAIRLTKIDFYKLQQTGLDKWMAAELFEHWIKKFKLQFNKRISPLAHNWTFDQMYVRDWLGNATFEDIVDGRFRDTQSTALYLNDVADFKVEQVPFAKVNLSWLAKQMNIVNPRAHSALGDCITTAEIYKRLVQRMF